MGVRCATRSDGKHAQVAVTLVVAVQSNTATAEALRGNSTERSERRENLEEEPSPREHRAGQSGNTLRGNGLVNGAKP